MVKMAREELCLEYWFSRMRPFLLKDEVGMGVACVALMMSLIKGRYSGHLHCDSMRKEPTACDNLYGDGLLGMGDMVYAKDGKNVAKTAFPMRGELLFSVVKDNL